MSDERHKAKNISFSEAARFATGKTLDVNREACILGALDGLERSRVSFKLWFDNAKSQTERNAVSQLLSKVEDMIRLTSNFSRIG